MPQYAAKPNKQQQIDGEIKDRDKTPAARQIGVSLQARRCRVGAGIIHWGGKLIGKGMKAAWHSSRL